MPIPQILFWFRKAVPAPEKKNFNTQTGVHFEEVAEMMDALKGDDAASEASLAAVRSALHDFATDMKSGAVQVSVSDPVELTDAICDQIVTGVGVAHMAAIDIVPAVQEVADSNDSKFDADGKPIFNADKKIMKGPNYFKARLGRFAQHARFLSAPAKAC